MKVTFAQSIATATITLLLVLFIRLPRLNKQPTASAHPD
jgi:hypothetical protein